MTSLAGAVRAPLEANRRVLAAGTFALLGLIDIVFGHFAARGDATFALALADASVHVPSLHVPAAATAYAEFVAAWKDADPTLAQVTHARAYLAAAAQKRP